MMTGPALIEPSLRTLCELCEDQLQVQRTKRLSPVEVSKHATTLERLEPGSLLVAFSRKLVLGSGACSRASARASRWSTARFRQRCVASRPGASAKARADIMVATDAVGMGLNLPAHTLCFYTDEKFDGIQNRQLKVQEVKQIGGRAGRFGHHDSGEITALDPQTLKSIRRLFNSPDAPVDLSQFQVRPSIDHLSAISELMGEPSLLRAWLTFNRNINYGEAFISVLLDELAEWIELIDDPKIPWLRWTFACTPIRGGFDSPASQHAQRWIKRVAEIRHPDAQTAARQRSGQPGKHAARGETYLHLSVACPSISPSTTTVKTRASCSTMPSPVNCHASVNRVRRNAAAAAGRPAALSMRGRCAGLHLQAPLCASL